MAKYLGGKCLGSSSRSERRRSYSGRSACSTTRAVVDMDMAHAGIPIFVDGDHRVEQCLQTPPRLGHDGHHRHAEHCAQMLVIEYGAARFEFVVHVERHDHLGVDVDQFGGKIEITFEIRGHYGVDDHVGRVVHQMAAHVQLFGRIGREGVGAGQIGDDEPVSSVTIFAALGVDGHPAVIAYMFVAARNGVEQRGLAAVGIADQRDVDRAGCAWRSPPRNPHRRVQRTFPPPRRAAAAPLRR